MPIIQHNGLDTVGLVLRDIMHVIPLLTSSNSYLSSSASQSEYLSNITHLQSMSDDEKLRLAECDSPIMILFHSTSSALSQTPPIPSNASEPADSATPVISIDDSSFTAIIQSCSRCCCNIMSQALLTAIASEAPVNTWGHAAAVRLCLQLATYTGIENTVMSACISVVGAFFTSCFCYVCSWRIIVTHRVALKCRF